MNIMPKPNRNFTVIQNDIFNNYPDMSAKSKFMLLQILSKPDDWKLNLHWLAKQNSEGIHAVKSSVKEWADNGFLHKFTARADGRIKEVVPVVCFPPLTREEAKAHFNGKYQQAQNQPKDRPEVKPIEQIEPEIIDEVVICDTAIAEKETCQQEINLVENQTAENQPLLNTDNNKNEFKQTLRVTTTTTPEAVPEPMPEAVPEPMPEAAIYDHDTLLPVPSSSSPPNEIINLIPEQHRSPVVLSLVNKAMVDYPVWEVEEAVAYAAANVRGGSFQFKAYLDKTLKNKWGEGFMDAMGNSNPFGQDLFQARQFPNGFTTGSKRLDGNLAACLEFAALSKRGRATA